MNNGNIEVGLRDRFSAHGEEVVRSRIDPFESGVMKSPFTWPDVISLPEHWRNDETLVAKVDGIVAGRAVLETVHYPFGELENLEIMPAFRRHGLGSRLVAEAMKRASDMGFLALHLQTFLNDKPAHSLYARHGFLPSTQGEMLRMVRFLNYPALPQFLAEHPLALFDSRPGDGTWDLSWTDAIAKERLSTGLSGGSCQFDSDGFGPGIRAFQLRSGEADFQSSLSGPSEITKGEAFDLQIEVTNAAEQAIDGACRLLLNHGFAPGAQGFAAIHVEPDATEKLTLSVQVLDSFDDELWKICAYPSVSITVEFFVGEHVFWLSHQVKVHGDQIPEA